MVAVLTEILCWYHKHIRDALLMLVWEFRPKAASWTGHYCYSRQYLELTCHQKKNVNDVQRDGSVGLTHCSFLCMRPTDLYCHVNP
jgi:hypothetical protein